MANILVTTRMNPEARAKLENAGHTLFDCEATDWQTKRDMAKACGAEAVACWSITYPREFFETLPDLKLLALPSAGFDRIDLETARARGVVVTNAGDGNAETVAEHAVMLMLASARRYTYAQKTLRGEMPWHGENDIPYTELLGKTVSVLGYGNIASRVARICALGFNMRVLAYHPRIADKKLPDYVTPCPDWDDAFSQADFVSVHIPGRESNRGIVGAREFSLMKKSAYFINTGRGMVVDEKALVRALEDGVIAGAGLDVFEKEPTTPDNPLFKMETCVCTPHTGGDSPEADRRVFDIVADNIISVLSGGAPLTPVSKK